MTDSTTQQAFTPAQAAALELLRRDAALSSLEAYRAAIAPSGLPDFAHPHAAHHRLIAHHLERLARREIRRLMILLPPGSAKSTIANVQWLTYLLARNPREQILAVSHGEELAESFARRKRLVLQSQEWQAVAGTALADDQQSLHRFATAAGGLHISAGVGSAITGLRASVGLIDDPISGFEVALSPSQLAKIVAWHDTDYRSRLLPDAVELLITTRWARGDLAGVLIDRAAAGFEDWTILRIPMLADSRDDPLHRAHGEPLWPEWYNERMVAEARRDALRWACLYQQSPLDEVGKWVGHENIRYIDRLPKPMRMMAAVDLALSIGKGDWSVIAVGGIDEPRNLVIADLWRDRVSPDQTAKRLLELCDQYKVQEVLVDDDNASKLFQQVMVETCRAKGRGPLSMRLMPMRGKDKETRAAPLRGLFLSGRVHVMQREDFTPELVAELLRFPDPSGHDDQVDALGLMARLHAERSGPEPIRAPKARTENPAIEFIDGKPYYKQPLDDLWEDNRSRRDPFGPRIRM